MKLQMVYVIFVYGWKHRDLEGGSSLSKSWKRFLNAWTWPTTMSRTVSSRLRRIRLNLWKQMEWSNPLSSVMVYQAPNSLCIDILSRITVKEVRLNESKIIRGSETFSRGSETIMRGSETFSRGSETKNRWKPFLGMSFSGAYDIIWYIMISYGAKDLLFLSGLRLKPFFLNFFCVF